MADTYTSFTDLAGRHSEGRDWRREYVDRGSQTLVMAPHGGWIEPFTSELARVVAGDDFSFYSFQGLKDRGNRHLHITSHRFDEPLGLRAASNARWVLAIHGEKTSTRSFVMIGGLWDRFRGRMAAAMGEAGIRVESPREGLRGTHLRNICNRGRAGRGGQLEVSEGLRRSLGADPGELGRFAEAVRRVLIELEREGRAGND